MLSRKILVASALLASVATGSAFAADLRTKAVAPVAAPAYYPAAPVFTWAGGYVGLNAGVAFGSNNKHTMTVYDSSGVPLVKGTDYNDYTSYKNDNNARFTGGLAVGYNWQFSNNVVVGLEADVSYLNRPKNTYAANIPASPGSDPYLVGVNSPRNSNWFGTVRGRLGYALDRALIYVTGGFAFAGDRTGATADVYIPSNPSVDRYTSTSSSSHIGWTLGAGVDYALTNNWVAKLEYLYVDLGKENVYLTAPVTAQKINAGSAKDNFSVIRTGIDYKF